MSAQLGRNQPSGEFLNSSIPQKPENSGISHNIVSTIGKTEERPLEIQSFHLRTVKGHELAHGCAISPLAHRAVLQEALEGDEKLP